MARSAASTGSFEQGRRALGRANEVRGARAALKRDLRAGGVAITQVLAATPECAGSAPVRELLEAVPRIGPVKAARLLRLARVRDGVPAGGLSDRQRARLIELLDIRK